MALKDMLLHIDHSPGYPERLDLAIGLALTHQAHLKGIYAVSHAYYAPSDGRDAGAARQAEEMFKERTSRAGVSAEWLYVDWNVIGVSVTEILSRYSYYSDLMIVGQPASSQTESSATYDLSALGLGAACPLLVVPRSGGFTLTGSRVMVAWRSGREASRSIRDAMPILEKAQLVGVVTIDSPDEENPSFLDDDVSNIRSHLAQHQVAADHEHIYAGFDITVGDLLLNHAFEKKIDLLVMGAFTASHRGYSLSPVAKHLLNHMTVPMLISH